MGVLQVMSVEVVLPADARLWRP